MRCSNCGKDIPFEGKVCPYCKVDKTGDKMIQNAGCLGGVAGLIVGGIIAGIFHLEDAAPFWVMLISFFVGMGIAVNKAQEKSKAYYAKQAAAAKNADLERMREQAQISATANAAMMQAPPPRYIEADPPPPMDFAAIAKREEAALLATGDYRKCPFCAEIIKAEARVCRFCQRDIPSLQQQDR